MNKKRNIGLDFARMMAMALVWVGHSADFSLGFDPRFKEFWGVVSLETFFALSGFLVGKSLIQTVTSHQPRIAMRNFYINRLIRTVPLYYLVLFITSITTGSNIPLSNFLFLQNFKPEDLDFFPPSWSLPVEAWFYFLIPPLLLLLYRLFSRHKGQKLSVNLSILVLCVIPLVLRTGHILWNDPEWDFGVRKQVLLRMDALMLGVYFAAMKLYEPERYQKLAKHPLTLLVSIAGMLGLYGWYYVYLAEGATFDHSALGKILIFTLLPVFCCLLVIYLENAVIFEKLRGTILEKIICGISSLGYSIYLVHFGVFLAIAPYFVGTRFMISWLGFLLAIAASIAISFVSYWLIEVPLTKLKDKLIARV